MLLGTTSRNATLPVSPHMLDRLWPSFAKLRNDLLSKHGAALPDAVRDSLLAMDDDDDDDDEPQSASTPFSHNDGKNLHQIGVMTRRVNTFFEGQMTQKTSEAVYTSATLGAYDAMVWNFNSPFHWRIHPQEIDALYEQGLKESRCHCEVAVGTGLFLREWAKLQSASREEEDKENEPANTGLQHLTLMDLSPSSLEGCYRRLEQEEYFANHVSIDKVQANILKAPSKSLQGTFDSVCANFLLHCIHGDSLRDKRAAIQSCASLLKAEGVFFGSTILGRDLEADASVAGPHAVATNQFYNQLGIFGNQGDTFEDMASILEDLFRDVAIFKVGYCAVWLAHNPKYEPTRQ